MTSVLTACLLASCQLPHGRIWIASTSTPGTVLIRVSDGRGGPLSDVQHVIVDGGPLIPQTGTHLRSYLWYVATRPGRDVALDSIRYGQVPPGMVGTTPVPSLLPGNYWVTVKARGAGQGMSTTFTVMPDERVVGDTTTYP